MKQGAPESAHEYASDEELGPGAVVRLNGRDWLVERADDQGRLVAKPARYRLRLVHPEGREELGGFRRYRPDGPRLGHALTTLEDGHPISWEVVDVQLAWDERGEPYLDLRAERDYEEVEELPDHELEHTLARREADFPEGALTRMNQAAREGLSVELVALDPGEEPDWEEARRYIDALILEEIEDDLVELAGVNPDRDPRDTWLDTIKERLLQDVERFRADVEGEHDQIEEWEFLDGRVFASLGREEDESNPDSGHGWLCRLWDSGALGAAGFSRIRKAEIVPT